MADVFTKSKRSEVMSRIHGMENKSTEIALMRILRAHQIHGWRRHQLLPGKPDFTFREEKLAVFVDGCFWHRCPIHATYPANNRDFWEHKLEANKVRDRAVSRALKRLGWRVLRIWEHELTNPQRVAQRVIRSLTEGVPHHG